MTDRNQNLIKERNKFLFPEMHEIHKLISKKTTRDSRASYQSRKLLLHVKTVRFSTHTPSHSHFPYITNSANRYS